MDVTVPTRNSIISAAIVQYLFFVSWGIFHYRLLHITYTTDLLFVARIASRGLTVAIIISDEPQHQRMDS
jgi:hypothetical protein